MDVHQFHCDPKLQWGRGQLTADNGATSVRNVRERVFHQSKSSQNVLPDWRRVVSELQSRGVRRAAELARQVAANGAAPEKLLEIIQEFDQRRSSHWPSPEGVLPNRCAAWHVPADTAWPHTPGSDKPVRDAYMERESLKYQRIKRLKSQGVSHAEAVERIAAVS